MGFIDNLKNMINGHTPEPLVSNNVIYTNNEMSESIAKNSYMYKLQEAMVWYIGDVTALIEFYRNRSSNDCLFWKYAGDMQMSRTTHVNLCKNVIDNFVDVITTDLGRITISENGEEKLALIEKEYDFKEIIAEAIKYVLILGDGAWKIDFNEESVKILTVTFYEASKVEYRKDEIVFKDTETINGITYELHDIRGYGYIRYNAFRDEGYGRLLSVSLDVVDKWKGLQDIEFKRRDIMWAEKIVFYKSIQFDGRGDGMWFGDFGLLDSLDDIHNASVDNFGAAMLTTYIPEKYTKRSNENGGMIRPNFRHRFVAVNNDLSPDNKDRIVTDGREYNTSHGIELERNQLRKIIAGKCDESFISEGYSRRENAEASREKRFTTIQTCNKIISSIQKSLSRLIEKLIQGYDYIEKREVNENYKVTVEFGQFDSPSFEAQLKNLGQAYKDGVLNGYQALREAYQETKTDEELLEIYKLNMIEKLVIKGEQIEQIESIIDNINNLVYRHKKGGN